MFCPEGGVLERSRKEDRVKRQEASVVTFSDSLKERETNYGKKKEGG